MFIELIDALRCGAAHEESWLVLSATRLEARHVVEGVLGCPVCRTEYPIRRGVVDFRAPGRGELGSGAEDSPEATADPDSSGAIRLAAMMDLSDALGFAVLTGRWCRMADALQAMNDIPPLLLVDPPEDMDMRPGISGVRCGASLPLADGSARAVAIGAGSHRLLGSAVRATRAGGRVVAPASMAVPGELRELARDASWWVAQREAVASTPVTLHVRRSGAGVPPPMQSGKQGPGSP